MEEKCFDKNPSYGDVPVQPSEFSPSLACLGVSTEMLGSTLSSG